MQEQGRCPKCKSWNLEYGKIEHDEGTIKYPFQCNDCKQEGYEWYNVEFTDYTDLDENEIKGEELE